MSLKLKRNFYGYQFNGEYTSLEPNFNKPPYNYLDDTKKCNNLIFTGRLNNIIVIDVDTYKDNKKNLYWQNLINEHGNPDTYTIRTKNKGYHYYFIYDADIISSINSYPINIDIFNEDSNGNPKWVIGAGTHFNCGKYNIISNTTINPIPQWLKNIILTYKKERDSYFITDIIYNITKKQTAQIINDLLEHDISYCIDYPKWFMVTDILKGLNYKSLWKQFCNCALDNIKIIDISNNERIWSNIVPCRSINEITSILKIKEIKYTKSYTPISNLQGITKQTINMRYIDIRCVVNMGWLISTVIMKSDTGTGKTTTTFKYFKQNNFTHILSIVSRRSLVDQHIKNAKDNDIDMYSYEHKDIKKKKIVCYQLDSICRFIDNIEPKERLPTIREYVVYLDEINSTIKYLLQSSTMDKKRISIYSGLCEVLKNCKILICSDADISDLVFKYISSIRKPNTTIFVDNEYKNYTGINATEYIDINGIIKKLKARINRNEGFVCCFDQLRCLSHVYGLVFDESKKDKFLRISSEHRKFTNTEIWKNKFVFYSPSIIYGNDFVPDEPTNVFVFVKGGTIDPLQIVQQATRCRKIKHLYYHINSKNKWLKYKSLDDCTEQINIAYSKIKSDNTRYDENLLKSRITDKLYNELYDYNTYINDILCSDYRYHINNILLNKGFKLDCIGDKDTRTDLSNAQKSKGDKITDDEYEKHLKSYIDNTLQYEEPEIYEKWERRRELLCINKDELYLDIITHNKMFIGHINICRLFKNKDALDIEEAQNMVRNNLESDFSKIKIIDKITNLLGLKRFNFDIDPARLNETINDWSDNDSKNYNRITKHSNEHTNIYKSLYKILICLYRSMDSTLLETKQIMKKKKRFYAVKLNDITFKYHFDLYNIRQQSEKNTHPDLLSLFPNDNDLFID